MTARPLPDDMPAATAAGVAARPLRWIPSLYLAQGLPYAAVMALSVVMLKNLGVDNTRIALATGWLNLPWVLKPLVAPWVEARGGLRRTTVAMQAAGAVALLAIAAALVAMPTAAVAGSTALPDGVLLALAGFALAALASAWHDIAADGFYLQALDRRTQAAWVGVRSAAWRGAQIGAQGVLVVLAGTWQAEGLAAAQSWSRVFGCTALALGAMAAWHAWALPRPHAVHAEQRSPDRAPWRASVAAFLKRPDAAAVAVFLLLMRLPEALALKLVAPVLLDPLARGGLRLTTAQVGWVYGTLGVAALTLGGLAGGWLIARFGLRRCWWPLLLAMHGSVVLFALLAVAQPTGSAWAQGIVAVAVAVEQAGYGAGFAACLVFMLRMAARGDNPHATSHYSFATGLMALGMMLPGMAAGWLESRLGYARFFALTTACALPALLAAGWAVRDMLDGEATSDRPEG